MPDLDEIISSFVKESAIPIFGIADAHGFSDALPGWHPKELMPRCESVIVMGQPLIQHPLSMDKKTFYANRSWWDTQRIISQKIARWKSELFTILDRTGEGVASFGIFKPTIEPSFSYRLAQVEAGIAVYGRAGACIHPEFGSYYRVGVLLTEAKLHPTDRTHLDGFNPCEGCSICARACPIKAIDADARPGGGYARERCARFVLKMSERSGIRAYICAQCFSLCPWSMGRLGKDRIAEKYIS